MRWRRSRTYCREVEDAGLDGIWVFQNISGSGMKILRLEGGRMGESIFRRLGTGNGHGNPLGSLAIVVIDLGTSN